MEKIKKMDLDRSQVPFRRSYWVEQGKLLAGAYPGSADPAVTARNMRRLVDFGIRRIVNLLEESEEAFYAEYLTPYQEELSRIAGQQGISPSISRYPIADMDVPSSRMMRDILDEIDNSIVANHPVFVHCAGGRGRTGTVIGCYLVRHGRSGSEALNRINELRRHVPTANEPSPETRAQRDMVRNWQETGSR